MDGFSIALSGLQAASTRTQAGANNIANLQSKGYQATRVNLAEQPQGGVQVEGLSKDPSQGDPEGSNVDLATEFTQSNIDGLMYGANLKMIQAQDELMKSTLDLKA